MISPVAVVLGGTTPHVLLVKKLKLRGYYVILVDFLPNPPAKRFADEHVQESTLDKEVVLAIAKERKASLVISTCIDQANSVCCFVAEQLGLPHPYSYETSLLVTNKGMMKARMWESRIPTSPFILASSIETIQWDRLSYPCVVKPVDCNSSKGVHKADTKADVEKFVGEAISLSRTHQAIIEGFCSGYEIQVDCVALDNEACVVMTRQKMMTRRKITTVLQSYGSVVPAPLSDSLDKKVTEIANRIAKGFQLKNTPFFYQAIVSDNNINVLEFAPRIGGGLSFYMLQHFVGFDAVDAAIDSYLGKSFSPHYHSLQRCYRTCLLYAAACIFDHIEGLEEMKKNGIVEESFVTKSSGDILDGDLRSSNRVGAFVVSGNDAQELDQKVMMCLNKIRIIDIEGEDKMNRTLYANDDETPSV